MRICLPFATLAGVAILLLIRLAPGSATKADDSPKPPPIDYNRQIRPILADNCFACHGQDAKQRKQNLRLDTAKGAYALLESGEGHAVVPGKPEESDLIARVTTDDDSLQMPPPKSGKTVTKAQVELLRRWIAEGGKYADHWAFIKPQRPELPDVKNKKWARNGVDCFILAKLEEQNLQPSKEADKNTLIRRLTLDLTGLPPTIAEVDAFLADKSDDTYEKVVDRLLANPHYGERMAVEWLDAARFADTHGYHIDSGRDMSRWRRWVIDAFNNNKPFDQFTVEQLAGDLLPSATRDQKIASGFNRNHMINFEGGAIPEEYQTAYIVDEVNTTSTVWMGLTMGCCQCHDHKFDPMTMKDFYQLYAFFNNVPENGLDGSKGNAVPVLKEPTKDQTERVNELTDTVKALEAKLRGPLSPEYIKSLTAEQKKAQKELDGVNKKIPDTMVMQEMDSPRDTFMLLRGQYDKKGEKVAANVPKFLPPLPKGAKPNRLALARWLVDANHPLTARVTVNRYWQIYFGTGIVKTAEDFGTQGEWPTHPELLDYLASEFVQSGWDVKKMQRLLVTSATYRQSSLATPELREKDPENRLQARAPRLRLHAEFIRDQALAISGLINPEIGGASVSPYQPPGLWEELASRLDGANWTAQTYKQSKGTDLYKRTMYTFWKRTSPPPTLVTFDAPDREVCTVRRARTNTPLQALVLMNDPTYIEASRKFAERILKEGGTSVNEKLTFAFRTVLARSPKDAELQILRKMFDEQLTVYQNDRNAAEKLLKVGESPRDDKLDLTELAAWTMIASALLNLDETVTRG
jgi:mono/diheme cytochrome c family protein